MWAAAAVSEKGNILHLTYLTNKYKHTTLKPVENTGIIYFINSRSWILVPSILKEIPANRKLP